MPPEKLNILDRVEAQISQVFDPHIVADVNDAQIKVAKFGPRFDWHSHGSEDEAFLVLRGRIALDFRDGVVELGEGDFLCVPRGVEHRPRALTPEPVVVMVEPAGTLNTGDADSVLTVAAPKRLRAGG
ncbi:cupin domain-containing protein [Tritonibacter scottomollicae]|uniref:cupin domain-containing protein n=1 Tax=Tritonibacter scottomollicae TaxID=483013 RepID=UPI003BAB7F93